MRASSNPLLRGDGASVLAVGTCVVMLVGLSLTACRHGHAQLTTDTEPGMAGAMQQPVDATMRPDAREPSTHARSHVLLGIDFSKPLKLPECARYYNSFDRPDETCVYLRSLDHKPFKIEFSNGSAPDFLKWGNAIVSIDGRGRPDMLRFDIDDAPAQQGKAVDAMLATFGPPTSVENSVGTAKIGTWQHDDYVIQYLFEPGRGGSVQMETKAFHDTSTVSTAASEASNAR